MKPEDVNYVGRNLSSLYLNKNFYNFYTETCGETFKIQGGTLNCNSVRVIYLLKYKVCG